MRHERDEFERKLVQQLNEAANLQRAVAELEHAHQAVKAGLEDEVLRLRRELEARGFPPGTPKTGPSFAANVPPPVLGASGQMFGTLMAGSTGACSLRRGPCAKGGLLSGATPRHP